MNNDTLQIGHLPLREQAAIIRKVNEFLLDILAGVLPLGTEFVLDETPTGIQDAFTAEVMAEVAEVLA